MSQLSLYLDDSTMDSLRGSAARAGCSLSKYVAALIQKDLEKDAWPRGFWDLYGSIEDESFSEPDELSWNADAPRASF